MPLLTKLRMGSASPRRAYLGSTLVLGSSRADPTLANVVAIPQVVAVFVADPAYLYRDDGKVKVATGGDSVRQWRCAAGSGLVLARAGSGVTYETDGTRSWVQSKGRGRLQGSNPSRWSPDMMMAVAARNTAASAYGYFFTHAAPTHPFYSNSCVLVTRGSRSGFRGRSNSIDEESGFSIEVNVDYVINAMMTSRVGASVRMNGSSDRTVNGLWSTGDGNVAVLGINDSTPESSAGRVYGAVLTQGLPSVGDRDLVDQWLASLCEAKLTNTMS